MRPAICQAGSVLTSNYRMSPAVVDIFFQIVVFLFAISVHEAAHAWVALKRGDATAYMLGRVTLNPIKHIDPIGTVLLPLIAAFTGLPMIGWAKPTPVNTRNFKRIVLDDILTTIAGPISNFLVAIGVLIAFFLIARLAPNGREIIDIAISAHWRQANAYESSSLLMPVCVLLYWALFINLLLAVFNLIPLPPLDGSHLVRHFLPASLLKAYDTVGIFSLMILLVAGGRVVWFLLAPVLQLFHSILGKF